jgi:hypothetical protein
MHNIKTNFGRFHRICKSFFEDQADRSGNLQFYSRRPQMSDLEIIALSCVMEALSIDSENLLWSKLQSDYIALFPQLICRTRFNRRRRRLQPRIEALQSLVSAEPQEQSDTMIVDSIPVPVVKPVREKTYTIMRQDFDTAPAKGYSSVNRRWFIGYKLHVIIPRNAVVQQSALTKGNVHDINFLKEVDELPEGKQLLGARAYVSQPLQGDLFHSFRVRLKVPFRSNQHGYKKHPKRYRSKRQMVETFFAQMCDQFNLKRNDAKCYEGLLTRMSSKLSAMTMLNWLNYLNSRKIAQLKHALAFY